MTTELSRALDLTEQGMFVFPVNHTDENEKKPLTKHGHLDASQDPGVIQDWWEKWPNAKTGVACGKSGIAVADIDTKNGKDGWTSLDEAWVDLGDPFTYETGTGGSHLIYLAPEGRDLNGVANYRDMEGVDRRAGSSWILWVGPVPKREDLHPAPEWLLDESRTRAVQGFDGTIQEWYESLVPGKPNVMVRRAIKAINADMSHSDMVGATYEAIRLGAEGATGVPELIDALEEAWMNRPAGNHTTPEEAWEYKFQQALLGGLEKYGETTELLKNLPPYNIGMVPPSVPVNLVTAKNTGKSGFSQLLGLLVKETTDNDRIASILWNAPATKELAREWGLYFTYTRIQESRIRPEPTRENPRIEEARERAHDLKVRVGSDQSGWLDLLAPEERELLASRPNFTDLVEQHAQSLEYDQLAYFRSAAWNIASLAFGRKGVVPVSATQSHGLNLWQIVMGYSGTGKSVVDGFQTQILDLVMLHDGAEVPYDLGAESSIQGLHLALLQRDNLASLFSTDEASGWFKRLKVNEWNSGMEDMLADWYMGRVSASNKISLKELRGKTATTSFNLHMFATPDRLTETLTRDQFMSGFLARIMWSFGNPRTDSDEMFDVFKNSSEEIDDVEVAPRVIRDIAADLSAARAVSLKTQVLKPTEEAKRRMSQAYKKMYRSLQNEKNWDVIEPALTRHMEAMLKAAGLCAMYREDTTIELVDALHAIRAVEEWVKNLVRVADLVSQGDFQRRCAELESFLRQTGGSASGAKIYHRFRNWIVRDAKEIDNVLTYLTQAGIINRDDANNGLKYELNGEGE